MAILLKTRKLNKDVQMKKLEKIHNDLKNWVDVNHYPLQLPNGGAGYVFDEKNEIHTATSSIRDWCNIILQHTKQFKD
jgi:hypothetical protein